MSKSDDPAESGLMFRTGGGAGAGAPAAEILEAWRDRDFVAAFSVGRERGAAAHGQAALLGPATVDPILQRHDLPPSAAGLAAEALALAALLGAALKFDGRLILQAQGDGPIAMLVAEFTSSGGLRAYMREPADKTAIAPAPIGQRPVLRALLGEGLLSLTIDQGPDMDVYQSLAPLEGDRLDECMAAFFAQAIQQDAVLRLASARLIDQSGRESWRVGGILLQRFAGDAARGSDDEDWNRAATLFSTLSDAELVDPDLTPADLLYRLFHEDGVTLFPARPLVEACSCNRERLVALLAQFSGEELADSATEDGHIHARCEFCARTYRIDPAELGGGV